MTNEQARRLAKVNIALCTLLPRPARSEPWHEQAWQENVPASVEDGDVLDVDIDALTVGALRTLCEDSMERAHNAPRLAAWLVAVCAFEADARDRGEPGPAVALDTDNWTPLEFEEARRFAGTLAVDTADPAAAEFLNEVRAHLARVLRRAPALVGG